MMTTRMWMLSLAWLAIGCGTTPTADAVRSGANSSICLRNWSTSHGPSPTRG